jgi:hypothetical protein
MPILKFRYPNMVSVGRAMLKFFTLNSNRAFQNVTFAGKKLFGSHTDTRLDLIYAPAEPN